MTRFSFDLSPKHVEVMDLYLLDSQTFCKNPPSVLDPERPVPLEIVEFLGPQEECRSICDEYFRGVHETMPFMSKKTCCRNVEGYDEQKNASFALLLLTMKLISQPPPTDVHSSASPLYLATKQYYALIESVSVSLHLLQAAVLISLYEVGQGVHPAAYLSIGNATRLSILMGLHDRYNAAQLFKAADTMTLREEERRTAWAISVLERYINVGTSGLPLATPEAGYAALLPCSELSWNSGDVSPNPPLFSSKMAPSTDVGSFASTCQAAHILGRVLHHRNDRRTDPSFRLAEALQLHRTLSALDTDLEQRYVTAMSTVGSKEELSPCSAALNVALALCCAARHLLYSMYGCGIEKDEGLPEVSRVPEELEMQRVSLEGIKILSLTGTARLVSVVNLVMGDSGKSPSTISPLLCYALYHAASECAWFYKEFQDQEMATYLKGYVDALRAMETRWRVAGLLA